MEKIAICGGTIPGLGQKNVLIDHGNVVDLIADSENLSDDWIRMDAANKLVIPGGIDPHVHLQLPTEAGPTTDDFLSGSKAALAGGTTSLIDFVTPSRGQLLSEAYANRLNEASRAVVPVNFHMGVTWWDETVPGQMRWCVEEAGIKSFKVYLAYGSTIGITMQQLRGVMVEAARLQAVVAVHAEDGTVIDRLRDEIVASGCHSPLGHCLSRPVETEVAAVAEVIQLVRETGCAVYFVHISTAPAAWLIGQAKTEGLPVMAETCVQYLVLNDEVYRRPFNLSAPCVISPPLRSHDHVAGLWKALAQGVFDVVSTDHCPFNLKGQKDRGSNDFRLIPNGAGGIEYRLSLLWSFGVVNRLIDPGLWIRLVSSNPAKIFGLTGQDEIRRGGRADLVIWNTHSERIICAENQFQCCDTNIYEGIRIEGGAEVVFLQGKRVFDSKTGLI